jgi:RNA polymerase sigma factor (sigma-70 family)
MIELIERVREYQRATHVDHRVRVAEIIVREVGPALRSYMRHTLDEESAKESFQETLRAIAGGLGTFKGRSTKQVWSWCYGIARHKINDAHRTRKSERTEFLDTKALWEAVEASGEAEAILRGERLDLEYAMNLLRQAKPSCCDYLLSYYIQGWDYAEIARTYKVRYDTARMNIRRCLELAQSLISRND